jgi:predicted component of type VI protein secretion system
MAEFLHYGLPDFSENSASLSRSINEMQAAE